MKKNATIKAATGFRGMKPDAVFSTANAIYGGLNGNANIPNRLAPEFPHIDKPLRSLTKATNGLYPQGIRLPDD
jgi:hypothetical protein